jgi:hypothetical protein
MNKQAGAIVVSILFAVCTAGASYAAGASEPQGSNPAKVGEGSNVSPASAPPRMVTGELLKIEGNNYTVKDQSGKEVRFQLDEGRTMMNAHPKVGDKIMAEIEPQGYAYSLNLVSESTAPTKK